MKQTAVQWLFEEYKKREIATDEMVELFKQAEQREKEQMKALYTMHIVNTRTMELYDFDEYYSETFKSE